MRFARIFCASESYELYNMKCRERDGEKSKRGCLQKCERISWFELKRHAGVLSRTAWADGNLLEDIFSIHTFRCKSYFAPSFQPHNVLTSPCGVYYKVKCICIIWLRNYYSRKKDESFVGWLVSHLEFGGYLMHFVNCFFGDLNSIIPIRRSIFSVRWSVWRKQFQND